MPAAAGSLPLVIVSQHCKSPTLHSEGGMRPRATVVGVAAAKVTRETVASVANSRNIVGKAVLNLNHFVGVRMNDL